MPTTRDYVESALMAVAVVVFGIVFLWAMIGLHHWTEAGKPACMDNKSGPIVACHTRAECVRVNCM